MADQKIPDGGYGWVVMICTMFMLTLWAGSFGSFGVLFTPFVEYFEESKTVISWIAAFKLSTLGLVGMVVGPLIRTFGSKKMTLVGSSLISIGYICSIFAPSAAVLYITYGLIPGFGYGCHIVCAPVSVQQYFDKRRTFAVGVTMCGISLGSFGFPPLTAFLLNRYGWRGTILILAAIQLHGLICGALLRPLVHKTKRTENKELEAIDGKHSINDITPKITTEIKPTQEDKSSEQIGGSTMLTKHSSQPEFGLNDTKMATNQKPLKKQQCLDFCKSVIDFSLFKDGPFMIYCLGVYFQKMGHFLVFTFLPVRGMSTGVDRQVASYLLSVLGISGGIGRILFGLVADKIGIKRIYLNGIAAVIGGILSALSPLYKTYWSLALYSALFGFVSSIYIILEVGCIVDLWGREVIARATGIIMVFIGLCNLTGTPLTGFLMDITKSTSVPFLVLGCAQIVGGILMGIGSTLQRYRNLHTPPREKELYIEHELINPAKGNS